MACSSPECCARRRRTSRADIITSLVPRSRRVACLCPQARDGRAHTHGIREKRIIGFQGPRICRASWKNPSRRAYQPNGTPGLEPVGPRRLLTVLTTVEITLTGMVFALIGDAAASTDPSFGQGQSLSAIGRCAYAARHSCLPTTDWDAAGHAYARRARPVYYAARP